MENNKFAKLDNYSTGPDKLSENRTSTCKLKKAIMMLVKELNIKNGSFKIFVHDGRPGSRIEVQNRVMTDI